MHIRKGPSTSAPKVPNKVLKKGHAVVASPVDESWARIDGTSEYFHFKDYTTEEQLLTPQLDQIVSCDIPLKAGALLGYTGLCEAEGAPAGYTTVHVEVFAGNDAEEFLKNPKQDGKPTQFLIAEGAPLFHRDSKYPSPATIPRLARAAGTSVKVTRQPPAGGWVQVIDTRLVATVDRSWLTWNTQAKRYTANAEHLDNVRQALQGSASGVTVDAQSQFELVAKLDGAAPRRTIALAVQESDAAQYWVKRSWLDGQQRLTADHSDCLADNPAAPLFSRSAGTVAYESVVDGRHAETDLDGNTAWYKVNPCGVEGWISDDHVKKCSPYDWPGFKVAKEDEPDKMLATVFPLTSTARDRRVDYDKLPSFFKKLFDEIDTEAESKGVITPREMKAALKKPAVAYKLSRLICYHQSEWCADEMTTSYWQAILDSIGQVRADNLTARVKNVCWWNSVSSRARGFPPRSIYHWHPIAFVEHMNTLDELIWGQKVSAQFRERLFDIADNLHINPNHLMAAIAFETGETFSPSVPNATGSGAVGLIQFMPSTAVSLGTTTEQLKMMTPEAQLDYVERYFRPYAGRCNTLEDVYMAILLPSAIGKPDDHVLFRAGTVAYTQNSGLDADQDGNITKSEAAAKVREKLERGLQFAM